MLSLTLDDEKVYKAQTDNFLFIRQHIVFKKSQMDAFCHCSSVGVGGMTS